jgi:hypothetical protein
MAASPLAGLWPDHPVDDDVRVTRAWESATLPP